MNIRNINTGGYLVCSRGDVIATNGVGSCIVLCLWSPVIKIGGMAHMFTERKDPFDCDIFRSPGLSPDTAVPFLLNLMERRGANRATINARLIGGAYMFGNVPDGKMIDIGTGILEVARSVLSNEQIPIVWEAVGGLLGRSVKFKVETGDVEVSLTSGEKEIFI